MCCPRFESGLFILSTLKSVVLHVVDVGSDAVLAGRYYYHNDIHWATLTLVCILIPWSLTLAAAFWLWKNNSSDANFVFLVGAVVNCGPPARLLFAVWTKWRGEAEIAKFQVEREIPFF